MPRETKATPSYLHIVANIVDIQCVQSKDDFEDASEITQISNCWSFDSRSRDLSYLLAQCLYYRFSCQLRFMDDAPSRYNQDQSQIAMSLGSNQATPLGTLFSTTDFDTLNRPLRPVTRRRRLRVGAPYTMRGGGGGGQRRPMNRRCL
jgi:hypothetical protein